MEVEVALELGEAVDRRAVRVAAHVADVVATGQLEEARQQLARVLVLVLEHGQIGPEAVRLAELLEAPVFASRQIFVNFPNRHPLYCGTYPVAKDFAKVSGLEPDVLFLVGCQGVHGSVTEPSVLQIGPNPILMGRHYPLDVAVQCDVRGTLQALCEASVLPVGTSFRCQDYVDNHSPAYAGHAALFGDYIADDAEDLAHDFFAQALARAARAFRAPRSRPRPRRRPLSPDARDQRPALRARDAARGRLPQLL